VKLPVLLARKRTSLVRSPGVGTVRGKGVLGSLFLVGRFRSSKKRVGLFGFFLCFFGLVFFLVLVWCGFFFLIFFFKMVFFCFVFGLLWFCRFFVGGWGCVCFGV